MERTHWINFREILDEGSIVIMAKPFDRPKRSGVYFLVKDRRVVYVGQSVDVYLRINEHVGKKDFDSVAVIDVEPHNLNTVEAAYIYWIQPALNSSLPTHRYGKSCVEKLCSARKRFYAQSLTDREFSEFKI